MRTCKRFTVEGETRNPNMNIINPAMSVLRHPTPDFMKQWAWCRGKYIFESQPQCANHGYNTCHKGFDVETGISYVDLAFDRSSLDKEQKNQVWSQTAEKTKELTIEKCEVKCKI